jgi:hypothetical protein
LLDDPAKIMISRFALLFILVAASACSQSTRGSCLDVSSITRFGLASLARPQCKMARRHAVLAGRSGLVEIAGQPADWGWATLNQTVGIAVSLPDTVEAHELLPPTTGDAVPLSTRGPLMKAFRGGLPFTAPALKTGEQLVSRRAIAPEVYVNGQLCGYNLITEAPFSADVTKASTRAKPVGGARHQSWWQPRLGGLHPLSMGQISIAHLARFWRLGWRRWDESARPVCVSDLTVLNTPNLKTVKVEAEVDSTGPAFNGSLALTIRKGREEVWTGTLPVKVSGGGRVTVSRDVTIPSALPWNINRPELYTASASLAGVPHSDKSTTLVFAG